MSIKRDGIDKLSLNQKFHFNIALIMVLLPIFILGIFILYNCCNIIFGIYKENSSNSIKMISEENDEEED